MFVAVVRHCAPLFPQSPGDIWPYVSKILDKCNLLGRLLQQLAHGHDPAAGLIANLPSCCENFVAAFFIVPQAV